MRGVNLLEVAKNFFPFHPSFSIRPPTTTEEESHNVPTKQPQSARELQKLRGKKNGSTKRIGSRGAGRGRATNLSCQMMTLARSGSLSSPRSRDGDDGVACCQSNHSCFCLRARGREEGGIGRLEISLPFFFLSSTWLSFPSSAFLSPPWGASSAEMALSSGRPSSSPFFCER